MTTVRVHPAAESEVFEVARRYDRRLVGRGDRFLDQIAVVYRRIESQPRAASLVTRPASGREVRQVATRRFPYVVTYEVLPAEAVVLQVRHAGRRGQPWRRRTP